MSNNQASRSSALDNRQRSRSDQPSAKQQVEQDKMWLDNSGIGGTSNIGQPIDTDQSSRTIVEISSNNVINIWRRRSGIKPD